MTAADPASAPTALVAAGGSGERLGAGGPKALVPCAGKPLLAWCLDAFLRSDSIDRVVVAIVMDAHDEFEEAVGPARAAGLEVVLTAGGPSRSHSVKSALRLALAGPSGDGPAAWPSAVLVHDAARPLAGPRLIDECVGRITGDHSIEAVVPAARVVDTIKTAGADLIVESTLDRASLWAVQTPQAFDARALARVLGLGPGGDTTGDEAIAAATDDASLIESAGGRVAILPHREPNPKVTTPADLAEVERLLAAAGR
ncbi:MAG: 2-C-methyl-D-erythritol 4-phosphate cytidylyltransferase [Solirubrobacterales bacterium]